MMTCHGNESDGATVPLCPLGGTGGALVTADRPTNTMRALPHPYQINQGEPRRALPPALAGGGGVAVGLSGVRPGQANSQTANDIIRRQDLTAIVT